MLYHFVTIAHWCPRELFAMSREKRTECSPRGALVHTGFGRCISASHQTLAALIETEQMLSGELFAAVSFNC